MDQLAEWIDSLKGSHIPAQVIPVGSNRIVGCHGGNDCQCDCLCECDGGY